MGATLPTLLRAVHPGTIAMTDLRQRLRPKVLTRHLGDLGITETRDTKSCYKNSCVLCHCVRTHIYIKYQISTFWLLGHVLCAGWLIVWWLYYSKSG
jgi:hypothetical protein